MQNLPEDLQTQLTQKVKAFSTFFIAFPKCTSNLEHFEKKDEPSSLSIPKMIDPKGSAYLNV